MERHTLGPLPARGADVPESFTQVSCVTATTRVAVGFTNDARLPHPRPFAEQLNIGT
jgi:hypothetical protein